MVNNIQSFFELTRLDQGEDSPDVGIMYPKQSLSKIIWWQLRESPFCIAEKGRRVII